MLVYLSQALAKLPDSKLFFEFNLNVWLSMLKLDMVVRAIKRIHHFNREIEFVLDSKLTFW
uniref:Uncharacterized protein n=1 Tax=Octopus bimaculoides TaxID=37653 RepID=A0A0L8I9Z1_OCTBM